MAASLISLGRTAGANETTDGTVPSAVAKFYAAAEQEGGKASVWLARASHDLARCFPAERGDQRWNASAAHRYGLAHNSAGKPVYGEDGAVLTDTVKGKVVPRVPLVRVARRQFARYVDAGAALVAAGHTAREVPTDAEVDTVKRSLGIAYGAAERDQAGRTRTARPADGSDKGADAPDKGAPDKGAATGKREDSVKAPAGAGVPVPTGKPGTLSTFDQIVEQIGVWERAVKRDQLRLHDGQADRLMTAITDLAAAVTDQESRQATTDRGLRVNRVKSA